MAEAIKKPRPQFRNIGVAQIVNYRLPLAGKLSILHRISGVLLFISLPFLLYLFEQSLTSELSFAVLKGFVSSLPIKIIVLILSWAFLFHFFAGLRFLLLDTHRAVDKKGGRNSAAVSMILSSLVTLAVVLKLFGAF